MKRAQSAKMGKTPLFRAADNEFVLIFAYKIPQLISDSCTNFARSELLQVRGAGNRGGGPPFGGLISLIVAKLFAKFTDLQNQVCVLLRSR